MKTLIDSSVWVEYFSNGPKAKTVQSYLRSPHHIILPSLVSYEVYKKIKSSLGEQKAVLVLAHMERLSNELVSFDQALAPLAADMSLEHKIPMADAMIYAVAQSTGATIVTLDAHFKGLEHVKWLG